ncbi:MAG: lipopolysaccharide biosynthesis protein [Zhenhengia sp.]|uniref:lipopolysaccharide biosynthesis protein n=1 Tax=Zhenhengia sp. TaxID=2944208 RepID=UPI003993B43E
MRVAHTIKNIKVSFFFFLFTIVFNFISRSVFVKVLGPEITGYSNLINSLMGFLNMAEMGIGSAIAYSLYSPLKDKDFNKITDIMTLYKQLYNKVGLAVLSVGILLSFSIPFLIKGELPLKQAVVCFYILLVTSVVSYFLSYKQTLIIADQKQYKVTAISSIMRIIKIVIQIIVVIKIRSYVVWLILELIFSMVTWQFINLMIHRTYPEINFSSPKSRETLKRTYPNIIKNIKEIFAHKIASYIVYQTDGILITVFSNLVQTAIYSNYMMIVNNLISLVNTVVGSMSASIGNLIAEKDKEYTYKIFKKIHLIDNMLAIFICFALYKTCNYFIILWVGKEYLFSQGIFMVILLNVYFQISRGAIVRFKTAMGLFWDIWAPILEGVINLGFSIVLAKQIGLIGVFLGTVISNFVIIVIWHPIMVFKYGFEISSIKYYVYSIKILICGIVAIIGFNWIERMIYVPASIQQSFIGFIVYGMQVGIGFGSMLIIAFSIIKEFRELCMMSYKLVINKFSKSKVD